MSHLIPPCRYKVISGAFGDQFGVVDTSNDELVQTIGVRAEAESYARGRDADQAQAEHVELALDLVRRIDMVMSSNRLGHMSAADVTAALYGMGFGNMARGEILRGGGYA